MGYLHFQPQNAHRVRVESRQMLFHIPTTSLFELDDLDGEVLTFLAEKGQWPRMTCAPALPGKTPPRSRRNCAG